MGEEPGRNSCHVDRLGFFSVSPLHLLKRVQSVQVSAVAVGAANKLANCTLERILQGVSGSIWDCDVDPGVSRTEFAELLLGEWSGNLDRPARVPLRTSQNAAP